jgi:hypothetical protein
LYSLHRGRRTGLYTLVLNHFETSPQTVTVSPGPGETVSLRPGAASATLYRPFAAPERLELPAEIDTPPEEFAIVAFSG